MSTTSTSEIVRSIGETQRNVMKAVIIRTSREESHALSEDPFDYTTNEVIRPPYNFLSFATMPEICSELRPSVDAMVVNIEKLGYRIIPRPGVTSNNESIPKSILDEQATAWNFFENAVLDEDIGSLEELRGRIREDLELTGNAYLEIIPSVEDLMIPAGLQHLPSWTMRLVKQDVVSTVHEIPRAVRDANGNWSIARFTTAKRFRRFVQIREAGLRKVYFKEWGDPRKIYSIDGNEASENVNPNELAHEVIHFKLYSPRSPYGLPRFTGNLFGIYGSRAAEEINYRTFDNNQIPALALLATNVSVTDESIDRLTEFFEERVQGNKNYASMVIIEAVPGGEGLRDPSAMRLDLKPLTEHQHTDSMFKEYRSDNNDAVRRAYRLPPIFVGRCVPIDTEFMTENGWKRFDDISEDEKVATVVSKTGELQFQIPSNRYIYDYDGKLIRFANTRAIDVTVTPNHKMLNRSIGSWVFSEASEIPEWHREFMLGALDWHGVEQEDISIPYTPRLNAVDIGNSKNKTRDYERILREDVKRQKYSKLSMDLFLEFLGYFVAEGSTTDRRGSISLSQNKNFVYDRMLEVIEGLGFDSPCCSSSREDQMNITISNVPLWMWLRENCGVSSNVKRFPRWILELSKRQLRIFYDALMMGDGSWCHRGKDGSGTYSTTSKYLADLFQELCFRLGFRTTSRFVTPTNSNWSSKWSITISGSPTNHVMNVNEIKSTVQYCGKVCCFTTTNGTIVTRQHGKIMVSGNSDDYNRAVAEASRKLAEEQIFAPERQAIDKKFTNTILARLGLANVVFMSNTPNVTDNYELTQLLSVAEHSGGMTPRIANLVIADVMGREITEPLAEINPDLPFTLTKYQEEAKLREATMDGVDKSMIDNDKDYLRGVLKNVFAKILQKDRELAVLDDDERNFILQFIQTD